MTTRVLVVCGGGASSGFLAQNLRKAAKKAGVELEVNARSESDIPDYIGHIDVLLVGPHLAYMEDKLRAQVEPHGIKAAMLSQKVYSRLDGEGAFKLVQELVGTESHA